ncbi:MAG: phosphopyruvate hydratase [Lachnospiraceae bacterium]|nr:phosphopyruvate hydratase [Lachnospiraceae bacterium]
MERIAEVRGREILNARGRPTVEAELVTDRGIRVTASVPSGTSRGRYEAYELYDGGTRYGGYGTRKAAGNISSEINQALRGMDVTGQEEIDRALCCLDGTEDKSRLGGNALLAVSMAAARAGARAREMELYSYLYECRPSYQPGQKMELKLPDIMATVISGGVFSVSGMEFEDYMLLLHGFESFPDELEALCAMRQRLEKDLRKKYGNFPEDGGAMAAPCRCSEEAFEWMLQTAEALGYGEKISLGIDVAASELWNPADRIYRLGGGKTCSREELLEYYQKLCRNYPLTLIEDGFEQDDFDGFGLLRQRIPQIQVVGDDLFVTNKKRLERGIRGNCANGLLMKINQIGTVTEALKASETARQGGMDVIVSLRSGETTDDFIADLAVADRARQIKLGSPVRAERNAKYNRLLRIWCNSSDGGKFDMNFRRQACL